MVFNHVLKSKYLATWPQELLVDSQIYWWWRCANDVNIRTITNKHSGHFLILELGDYDYRGITANNWPHPRGNTVSFVPISVQLTRPETADDDIWITACEWVCYLSSDVEKSQLCIVTQCERHDWTVYLCVYLSTRVSTCLPECLAECVTWVAMLRRASCALSLNVNDMIGLSSCKLNTQTNQSAIILTPQLFHWFINNSTQGSHSFHWKKSRTFPRLSRTLVRNFPGPFRSPGMLKYKEKTPFTHNIRSIVHCRNCSMK